MLKSLAKVIAVLGGIAAVIWTMRDRFVSVTTSREPEPPTFRTQVSRETASVDSIDGIGPVFAKRLIAAGIPNLEKLAGASPDSVAEAASVSAARARSWIEQAQQQV